MSRPDWTDGHGLHLPAEVFDEAVAVVRELGVEEYGRTDAATIVDELLRAVGPKLVAASLRRVADRFDSTGDAR